jgi:hypothetical protein
MVHRELPILFQMPAVKGVQGGLASTATPKTAPAKILPPVAEPENSPPIEKSERKKSVPTTNPVVRREPTPPGRWFDGQGKLITICFLIALTATIYFARSQTKKGPQTQDQWQTTHPGDAGDVANGMTPPSVVVPGPEAKPNPEPPALVATPTPPPAPAPTPPPAPVPAPAPQVAVQPAPAEAATPAPEVKLLTPKDPPAESASAPANIASNPAPSVPAEGPPVAPNTTPPEEPRVATAPARSGWQPPTDAPAEPPTGYGTGNTAPVPNNSYLLNQNGYQPPATRYQPPRSPASAPAGSSLYPTTDPARFRYYNPPGGNGAAGNAIPGSQPRNERTGSSLY